ncbi:glycosyltransferase family 2 protein [Streptomyces sp. NPDC087420]|uniref:glycosyltransferase family 2 protein n=1 Tax=Streptomyces sp. NPDC087420 TaxID=3365785 RepID=UPI003836EF6B
MTTDERNPDRPHDYLISIVLPCYNEEEVLDRTHRRVTEAVRDLPHEIIYVDDGSSDSTWSLIEGYADRATTVRAVRFSRNFGHQAACLAGLAEATGDAVVLMDADLQDPPELIPRMARAWLDGWSVVSARRTARHGESHLKKATAYAYYRILAGLSDRPVALDTGDFRLLDRQVVDFLTGLAGERALFLRGAISWSGFAETSIEYERDARLAGGTKYTPRKMIALSRSGLLASGSALPLRLPTYIGAASLLGAFGVGVARRSVRRAVPLGVFGLQSLASGVLGEYLLAAFQQVQGRPPYLVARRTSEARTAHGSEPRRPIKEFV